MLSTVANELIGACMVVSLIAICVAVVFGPMMALSGGFLAAGFWLSAGWCWLRDPNSSIDLTYL